MVAHGRAVFLGGVALGCCVTSCAVVLGGLDEGTAHIEEAPSDAARVDGGEGATLPLCPEYPAGTRRRAPIVIDNPGDPLDAHQIALDVDVGALVGTSKLRADGADLRVRSREGVAQPHWLSPGGTAWVRADLLRGETQLWLYYDAPGATSEASLADTFVRGVIDDIAFEGTSWSAVHDESVVAPSQTNEWSVIASGGQVTTYLARPPSTNGSMAAICTMMTFPHGRTYALDVEVDIVLADGAGATIRIDDLAVWNGGALGRRTATTTEDVPILPGYHHVCLGVAASDSSVGQGVDARFALPRVRRRAGRYDAFEPIGRVRFDREETCP